MTTRTTPARSGPWPAWVGFATAVLAVLLAILPQVILNVGLIPRLITASDPRVRVDWDGAWMFLPGWVHVRGLEVEESRGDTSWRLQVGSVTTYVSLLSLLDSQLVVSHPFVDDVSFFLRGDQDATDALDLALPPLTAPPGRPRVTRAPDDPAHGAHHAPSPWTFHVRSLRSNSVREVWVGPYRLLVDSGDLALSGVFRPGLKLELQTLRFVGVNGEAWRGDAFPGGRMVDADFDLTIAARLEEAPGGLDVLRGIDGEASMRFLVYDLGYLLRFVNPGVLPIETLSGGAGEAWMQARLGEGRLLPESELRVRGDALRWQLAPGLLTGRYALDARVHATDGGARTGVVLEIDDAKMLNREDRTVGAARLLEVRGEALPGATLGSAPTNVGLSIRLAEPARIDLAALNPWIGGLAHFTDGEARLALDLAYGENVLPSSDGATDPGARKQVLDLRIDRLEARVGKSLVRGRLRARLRGGEQGVLSEGTLAPGTLHLDMDRVELGDRERPELKDWSGTLIFRELQMRATPPRMQTRLQGQLDSAAPVIHLLVEQGELPPVLRDLLSVPDVKLSALVSATPKLATVRDLSVEGQHMSLKGRLSATGQGRTDAVLLMKLGFIPAGLEVKDGKVGLHLFRPYTWFASQQESAPRKPSADPD